MASAPHLQIIVVSTRDGRKGRAVADWFHQETLNHGGFDAELVDLAEVNLPLVDEPNHPRLRKYEHAHTKAWSALIERADAYVFVTPEYNYSAPPSLVNALDYLLHEWSYKPVGFVSYGGVSGGTRSVQVTKQIVTTLKMMPLPEAVTIPFFTRFLDAGTGVFAPDEPIRQSVPVLLDELRRWAAALAPLRAPR